MARVVLEQVGKAFRDGRGRTVAAVADVTLDIADGEFLVLVGPSGCGKSTTLRLIAGLEEMTSGTIRIGDRVVNGLEPKDRDIAMVFQNYALYPHLTVFENLAFGLQLRRLPRPEVERRVRGAAGILGLEPLLDRRPRELSGGQRQRVAVGRAMVREPQVFLFDEPLSNLDAQMRVQTRMELARLNDRLGTTMIYVTHDQVEAMTLGDRIVVMHEGRIQQVADPLTLYREPANRFVAGFIGSPPMGFVEGTLDAGRGEFRPDDTPLGTLRPDPIPAAAGSGRAVLGVRPEGWTLTAAGAGDDGPVVELVEPLGAETLLHVAAGASRVVVRVDGLGGWTTGERVGLGLRPGAAHWFDPQTGRALR